MNERLEERLQRFLEHEQLERELLQKKIAELERKLEQKADDVVSYQLLQQRRELEEERQQIKHLEQKISELESMNRHEKDTAGRREEKKPKSKLKSIFSFKAQKSLQGHKTASCKLFHYAVMAINIGSEIIDSTALITNADAVSASWLSKFVAIIAATADPGNATSRTAFVMSAEERPTTIAITNIKAG
ncbi:hypothetical protein RSC3_04126 [Bacillus paralicheniformis]|nr:hypothetical protein RSC3_04126 [Bacillus paralicheniformis]